MITIVNYGLGNLASIKNALLRLGLTATVSDDAEMINTSEIIILPGVGAANAGMKNLNEKSLTGPIINGLKLGKPFLGICLGMQLLFDKSEEGNTPCLGIIGGVVKKFKKKKRVPQIGWNQVQLKININKLAGNADAGESQKLSILTDNLANCQYYYFINSYYCQPSDKSIIVGTTKYGEEFPSLIVKDNIVATQFHPEKSGRTGQQLLKNIFRYFNLLKKERRK